MEPSGGPRVAFVVVTKGLDCPAGEVHRPSGARYTRDAIRGMLQFMGCKPRHAYKAAHLVFQKLEQFALEGTRKYRNGTRQLWAVGQHEDGVVYVAMPRSEFYELVCNTLTEYNYKYAPSSDEIKAACSLKERRRHIIVLLCGTSGSGKSTLASILANRLGISTVLSTDSVRHMMRSFTSAEETPLLFASTYEAGEALRKQQALNEARHQQQHLQQQMHSPHKAQGPQQDPRDPSLKRNSASGLPGAASGCINGAGAAPGAGTAAGEGPESGTASAPLPSPPVHAHDMVIRGYKAQCELVSEQLEQLICGFEARRQSLVVEGVHLHVGLVMRLLQQHPGVVPFLVYIKSEGKHIERMAVRAKYMTLDPNKNKYVKNMLNIRSIQDYLLRKAEKHAIPCVENTNIDRSVGLIHLTLLGCLKRMMKGDHVLDPGSSTLRVLHNEYTAVMETLAGSAVVPSATGAPTSAATASTMVAAAAAATAASGTCPAGGCLHWESSTGWQPPPAPPPARVLGSPRVFSRESAHSAPNSGTGGPRTQSGDGTGGIGAWGAGLGGEAAAMPAHRAALQQHSGSQVELPLGALPLASGDAGTAAAVAGVVLSSPQLKQGRADRRDSCSSPHEQLSATLPVGGGGVTSSLRPTAPASPKQHGGAPHGSGGFGGGCASVSGGGSPAVSSAFPNAQAFGSMFDFPEPLLADDVFASDAAGAQSAAAAAAQQLLSEALGRGLGLGLQAWPPGGAPEAAATDIVAGAAAAAAGSLWYDTAAGYDMVARAAVRIEAASPSRPLPDAVPSPPAALLSQLLQEAAVAAGGQQLPLPSPHGHALEQAAEGAEDPKLRYPRQHVRQQVSGCTASPRTGSRRSSGGDDRRGSSSGAGGAPETADSPVTWAVGSPVYVAPVGDGALLHDDSHDGDVSDGGSSGGDGVAIPVGSGSGCKRGKGARRSSGTPGACGDYDGRSGVGRGAAVASAGRGTPLGGAPVHVPPPRPPVSGSDLPQPPYSHPLRLPQQPAPQSAPQQGGALHRAQGGDTVGPHNPSEVSPVGHSLVTGPAASAPGAPPDASTLTPPPSCRSEASGCNTQPGANQEQTALRVGVGNGQPTKTAQAHFHAGTDTDVGAGPAEMLLPPLSSPLPSPPGAAEAMTMTCADDADARARAVAVKRFGGDCPEEVVRAMAQSAKFDAEMDDVTEQPQGAGPPRGASPPPPLPPHHQHQHQKALLSSPQQQLRHQQHHEHQHHHSRHQRSALSGHPPHQQPHQQGQQQNSSERGGFSFPHPGAAAAAAAAVHTGSPAGRPVGAPPAGPPTHGGGGVVGQPSSLAPAGPSGAMDLEGSGGQGLCSGAEAAGAALYGSPAAGISTPQAAGGVLIGACTGASPQAPSGSGSAFTGAHSWATTAAQGVPTFLRADSRRLGESSSGSPSGYSSDEVGDGSGSGDAGGGGSGAVRRRRDRSRVGPLGRDLLQDSDDQDDAGGYTGYRPGYGGASPLQEYGSVYESATHDDMDEHGDDEEALPLGRSNTIIRHLAGVMERNRMRASAAAAAGGQRPPGAVPPAQPQRSSNAPPPAASSGAAVRPLVGRRAAAAVGPRAPGGGAPGGGSGGGREGGGRGEVPGADAQLRQMLQGGSIGRLVAAGSAGAVASRGGSSSSHAANHSAGRLHVAPETEPSAVPAAALTGRLAAEDEQGGCGGRGGASRRLCDSGTGSSPDEATCQGGEGVAAKAAEDAALTGAGGSVSGTRQLHTPFAAASALPPGTT